MSKWYRDERECLQEYFQQQHHTCLQHWHPHYYNQQPYYWKLYLLLCSKQRTTLLPSLQSAAKVNKSKLYFPLPRVAFMLKFTLLFPLMLKSNIPCSINTLVHLNIFKLWYSPLFLIHNIINIQFKSCCKL